MLMENFVSECFNLLSRFSNDKLKDLIEKEKSRKPNKQYDASLWITFLLRLAHFGDLEKSYSMAFLGSSSISRFLSKREDNLKGQYAALLSLIRSVSDSANKQLSSSNHSSTTSSLVSNQSDSDKEAKYLLITMLNQLEHFILARTSLLLFYEQLSTETNNKVLVTDDLSKIIISTTDELNKHITNPLMKPLKDTYIMECECLQHLLSAQMYLQQPLYLESLLSLIAAHNHLHAWSVVLNHNKSKKSGFVGGSSKSSSNPPDIYIWLLGFKNFLISKFSFYFREVLSSQAGNNNDLKNIPKTNDYYSKVVAFSKKMETVSLMLFSRRYLHNPSQGYILPCIQHDISSKDSLNNQTAKTPLNDKRVNFKNMIFFSYPHERPSSRILEHLGDKFASMPRDSATSKISYDHIDNFTLVLSRVEGDIYMAAILTKRLNKQDNKVNSFMNDLCTELRGSKHFSNIKSGIK